MTNINTDGTKRITLALLGNSLDLAKADGFLVQQKGAVRYRDAYYLKYPDGEAWLFEYGVLVSWNMSENDRMQLRNELSPMILEPAESPLAERYSYRIDPEAVFKVHHDLIVIPEDNILIRLGLSHAFAQSTKLAFFEEEAQTVIQQNNHISKELALTGKIPLSRQSLAKLRGVLYSTSSDITLHFNLLDTPEFFWDYPELESYYLALSKYLDLTPRIEILNRKLETIHSLLEMLAGEQHHKHSAFLEWIIIVLIAVDILIYFF